MRQFPPQKHNFKQLNFIIMNTQTQTKREFIINAINEMTPSELIDLNNTYCQSANICDSEIYSNDEDFFETFFGTETLKAVQATQYGDYRYYDDYVTFNGYGNLDSFNYMDTDKLCELVGTIAEYIEENEQDFSHLFDFSDFTEE
jgi:hypothetical protein